MHQLLELPKVTFEEVEVNLYGKRAYVAGITHHEPILIDLGKFGDINLKPGDVLVNIEAEMNEQRVMFPELSLIEQKFEFNTSNIWRCGWTNFRLL